MPYDEFRDKIKNVLKSSDKPMTWTEIRTACALPQKFPNNQWVRKMEGDIGLKRVRDKQGIIHWQLA